MRCRSLFYRLVICVVVLGSLPSGFFPIVVASEVTVTQEVVDNSTAGTGNLSGGSGAGGGGGAAGGDAAGGDTGADVVPDIISDVIPDIIPEIVPDITLPDIVPDVTPSVIIPDTTSTVDSDTGDGGTSGDDTGSTGGSAGGTAGGSGETSGGVVLSFSQFVLSEVSDILTATSENIQIVATEVARISGVITKNTGEIVRSPVGRVVAKITEPIGILSGGVAIGSQILISTTTITSFSDIYLLIIRTIGLVLGMFRKKRRPWGTVYDSVTKRPLDPAYVTISKAGEEITDALTDLDGRFGFYVPAGVYTMLASKTNYEFPSKKLAGKTQDEIYENIYYGDPVENKGGEAVIRNIPLDPTTFDWNEFQKDKQKLFRLYSESERKWKKTFDFVYKMGFVGALLAAIFDGNYLNYIFVSFYLVIVIYQAFFIKKRTAVSILRAGTNEPMPFSIVKLFSAQVGNEVKSVVADRLGRFYLLVGQGEYIMTIDEKLSDGSYKTVYKSGVMDLKDGIVPNDIVVSPEDAPPPPVIPPPPPPSVPPVTPPPPVVPATPPVASTAPVNLPEVMPPDPVPAVRVEILPPRVNPEPMLPAVKPQDDST